MFDKLLAKFKTPKSEPLGGTGNETDPLQLAFAALLVEAARADENYAPQEVAIIDRALRSKFSLSAEAAVAVRVAAEAVQENANDIQRFTRVAKEMAHDEKIALMEELWEIILSDGERDSFEDTLMRRICGLIYVDDRESGAARQRVAARTNTQ